jgi:galactose mutarotase-like enzyme
MTLYRRGQFSIDSHGAYVVELHDESGRPVLFPRTTLEGKRRGGSHVCLPYFNPDEAGILPQHGFGRDVEWNIDVSGDAQSAVCSYDERAGIFQGLAAQIIYSLKDACFTTALTVANHGQNTFLISPGFHPYFSVDRESIVLNGKSVDLGEFEPFQSCPDMPTMTLTTNGKTVTIASDSLTHTVVWSDARGDYLCIEPTLTGGGFNSQTNQGGIEVAPGQAYKYTYTITWE